MMISHFSTPPVGGLWGAVVLVELLVFVVREKPGATPGNHRELGARVIGGRLWFGSRSAAMSSTLPLRRASRRLEISLMLNMGRWFHRSWRDSPSFFPPLFIQQSFIGFRMQSCTSETLRVSARRLEMRFLKTVGLSLCAVSLSAFVVASANAQDKPMMKKHHHHHGYHHHHVTKGKGGGRH
jgi:hypothetical protein